MKKLLLATLFISVITLSACDSKKNTDKEIEEAVVKVLNEKPEIIINALKKMGGGGQMSDEQVKKAIEENKEALFNDPTSPIIGNKNGSKVVVEFFDYNCGYCRKMLPNLIELIKDKDVKIILKELPILGENSIMASAASLAVHDIYPEKYFQFHQEFMNHQGQKDEAVIKQVAAKIGIDGNKIMKDMNNEKYAKILEGNAQLAQKLGVRGTPSLIVGTKFIRGMATAQVIEKAFKEAK